MALEVGAFEAKTQLSKLLELARRGERIIITKHGMPVAQLGPPGTPKKNDLAATIEELKTIRQRTMAGREKIKALIEEGRRL